MSTTRHSVTEESSFSPKKWVTALNCPKKGQRFPEDVSNTSSSILTSRNSSDTDDTAEESKTCLLNPLSYHKSSGYSNHHIKATIEAPTTLCMNGNGRLHATR